MQQIIKEYAELTSKYEDLEISKEAEIKKLKSENRKLNNRIDSAMKTLSKQQEEVVKPLIAECAKRETTCQNLTQELTEKTKCLKILFAISKSPLMSNLVHKEQRKRFTQEKLKEICDNAIYTLRQYRFEEIGAEKFVEGIYDDVKEQLKSKKNEVASSMAILSPSRAKAEHKEVFFSPP